jgi:uncharacterized phage protein (TIGR01671 family)
MSRKIKFRGKEIETGKWIYGAFVPDALEGSNDLVSWGFIRNYNREIHKMQTIEVDRETVGQYTGLRDKNGKEVYEGDIIRWDEKEWGEPFSEIVTWDYELFAIRKSDWKEYCEVAGNIYGNPELSQKQKLEDRAE